MKAPFEKRATNRRTIPESTRRFQPRAGAAGSRPALIQVVALLALCRSAGATTAAQLCPGTADPCVVNREVAVDPNSVIDLGDRALRLSGQGQLRILSGKLTLRAAALTVDASASIRTTGQRRDLPAAALEVTADAIAIAGRIDARGAPPGATVLRAAETLVLSGELLARSEAGDASGGGVDLSGAAITISGLLDLNGGREDIGGDLLVNATESLVMSGSSFVDVSGGEGGSIDLASDDTLRIDAGARLRADAEAVAEDGGAVSIVADGPLVMRGSISATARQGSEEDGGGDGGGVVISSDAEVDLLHGAAAIDASGGAPDGIGGDIEIESFFAALRSAAALTANVAEGDGLGGSIDVSAATGVVFLGSADARGGSVGGGDIDIDSDADLSIGAAAMLDASGVREGSGGAVDLVAAAALTVAGTIHADGGNAVGTSGGMVMARSCEVLVQASGVITALKPGGKTILAGRRRCEISGQLLGEAAGGRNELRFRATGEEPVINGSAVVVPAAVLVLDGTLAPCGPIAPSPTPTTIPTEDPSTATPSPTATLPPPTCPGDCDGNDRVDIAELVRAVSIALGRAPLSGCPAADRDGGGTVGINELIAAVAAALNGCAP